MWVVGLIQVFNMTDWKRSSPRTTERVAAATVDRIIHRRFIWVRFKFGAQSAHHIIISVWEDSGSLAVSPSVPLCLELCSCAWFCVATSALTVYLQGPQANEGISIESVSPLQGRSWGAS